MNQLEQFREQCAAVCDEAKKNISPDYIIGDDVRNAGIACCENIAKRIRALPLPEVSQDPVAWVMTMRDNIKNSLSFFTCKDIGEQWLIEEKELGLNDLKLQPLYVLPPDVEALRKENEQLKESLRYAIKESEAWAYECHGYEEIDTEEMKLAKERAK